MSDLAKGNSSPEGNLLFGFPSRESPRFIDGHPARIAIVGAGAFGCALAACAVRGGCEVVLFSRTRTREEEVRNDPLLSACGFELEDDTNFCLADFDLVLVAVASQALREVCGWMVENLKKRFADLQDAPSLWVVCASKGIERVTCKLPYEIIREVLPAHTRVGSLSGPSFARELRQGLPAAVVVASPDAPLRKRVKHLLHRALFRVYDSEDIVGVEVAGALKNVVAIVAGGCDGLGLGSNARAAVVTRGFGEIVQIGVRLGADSLTFLGLSGLGDLFLTTTGDLSRNRQFGLRLAKGESKDQIVNTMGEVIEGVTTAESAFELSQRMALDTPIIRVAYGVLYENLAVREALFSLITRHHKGEFDWKQQ